MGSSLTDEIDSTTPPRLKSSSHEFQRFERLLEIESPLYRALPDPSSHSSLFLRLLPGAWNSDQSSFTAIDLSTRLDEMLSRISSSLSSLLSSIDDAIEMTTFTSESSGVVMDSLHFSSYHLDEERTKFGAAGRPCPLFVVLLNRGAERRWRRRGLEKDWELAKCSLRTVKEVRVGLERARLRFVEFQNNVGHFKVCLRCLSCSSRRLFALIWSSTLIAEHASECRLI